MVAVYSHTAQPYITIYEWARRFKVEQLILNGSLEMIDPLLVLYLRMGYFLELTLVLYS